MPTAGRTKKQFKSRTELFVGPRQQMTMDLIFELRSAAEHLHRPFELVQGSSRRRRIEEYVTLAIFTETIARECFKRVLNSRELLGSFKNDESARSFWAKDREVREAMWGPPVDLDSLRDSLDWELVSDTVLL